MERTVLKIVIWRGKLSVLWSQISLNGFTDASPSNKISNHQTDDVCP